MPENLVAQVIVNYLNPDGTLVHEVMDGAKAGYRASNAPSKLDEYSEDNPPSNSIEFMSFWVDQKTIIVPFSRLVFASIVTPQREKPPRN